MGDKSKGKSKGAEKKKPKNTKLGLRPHEVREREVGVNKPPRAL